MSHNEQVKRLVRLAHENPEMRKGLLPVIREIQAAEKQTDLLIKKAFSDESEQFVAWCLMKQDSWSQNECQRVLDKIGVPFLEVSTATRGPLGKGEMVKVDATKNANPKNTEVCERRAEQVGTVFDVDGDALVIEFETGGKDRFEGRESGQKTGLYRWTPSGAGGSDKRAMVEAVYISDKTAKPPTKRRVEQVQQYLEKGLAKAESRERIYYSGLALKQAMGKNGYYFTVFAAQRDQYPTSINPSKGELLYLGVAGHRPGGWKQEFAKMIAEDAAGGGKD